jgi:molybdate transport system substrate-binding protein
MTRLTRARARWAVLLCAVLLPALVGCSGGAAGQGASPSAGDTSPRATVRVAAAADLKFALDEVSATLARATPPIDLAISYGSSGTFFQQLSNGAPFDLYLSADLEYPRKLVAAGLASSSDLFGYAVGRLVVWAPTGSPVDPRRGMAALADPQARRIAIANPEHAPYGVAAVAAMKSAGVYEAARSRLVLGENVAQAAEFVLSGSAQVGVIALSLARSPQLRGQGSYAEVPLDSYPRIDQGGVVLASAKEPAAARRVRDYLRSEAGVAVLKSYGFFLPGS